MDANLHWIANFIWSIADDVLRDLYVRGKYRDVILPMTVLRRLDAVLEPTKQPVLDAKAMLDKAGIVHQDQALRQAARQAFYNTSKFTLRDLRARASQQQLKADFEAYLDGYSPNVQDILEKFEFRNQIPRLSKADALGTLIEKFLSPDINLSPNPVVNGDGSIKVAGLDNHAMGTIFEELVRRFNEENNEEAGEHWTPRDAVRLMAKLVFLPIADQIESGTYLIYDGACGTGGMLTVAEGTLQELAAQHGKQVATHLYGQEINAETYAIAKADLLLKGEGEAADNIIGGPEYSTLSNDAFPSREFDFMLSNPPYGKSWKSDLERMGGKDGIKDPRFVIEHAGDPEYSLVTRSSDGQLLFLVNMLSKMKHGTALGSRLAEVHNGSSLFTGDAGQGESNIRRWIYVRPFPQVDDGRWQVSAGGGRQPAWARNGRELFFWGVDGALMTAAVDVTRGSAGFTVGTPMKLIEPRSFYTAEGKLNLGRTYDVSLDGRRFLMIKQAGDEQAGAAPSLIVVQHFDEELKRRVPAN
jgi:type I restriction enzyme M protein